MTHEEVVKKLDFLIRSYQNLIDNQVSEGEIVGPGVKGTWKVDAPIIKSYQNMIEALTLAKLAIKQYQMLKLDYNARLKDDMAAMLTEIQLEIEECVDGAEGSPQFEQGVTTARVQVVEIIQEKINELPSVTPQEPILDKIRAEIARYGSIWVGYAITKDTKTDKGIEKLVSDVLKQAKEQVLDVIDKYKAETEVEGGNNRA